MDTRVYGSLICQDGMPDILRCVESVAPYVDEYFIMDGGSKDGTWEWLNKYKDVYNLTLFQHEYDEQGAQRNRLLAKVPKGVWCLNIDQDEQIKCKGLRKFLRQINDDIMAGRGRDLPLTLRFPCVNLVDDTKHYNDNKLMFFGTKFFLNDRNLHFTPGYHMSICYFETEQNTNSLVVPDSWAIKHYAYLDNERIAKSATDPKRHYEPEEWDRKTWKIIDLPAKWRR